MDKFKLLAIGGRSTCIYFNVKYCGYFIQPSFFCRQILAFFYFKCSDICEENFLLIYFEYTYITYIRLFVLVHTNFYTIYKDLLNIEG